MNKVLINIFMTIAGLGLAIFSWLWLAGAVLFSQRGFSPKYSTWNSIIEAYAIKPDAAKSAALIAAVLLMVFIIVMYFLLRTSTKKKTFGKSSFASESDIKKMGLFRDKGIIIGQYKEKLLRLSGNVFVLLLAPTRSGKGVSCVVPNAATVGESMVIQDIKGENFDLTSRVRSEVLKQAVFVFNPYSSETHSWNPLDYVAKDLNLMAGDVAEIASNLYPQNDKDPFWSNSSRTLFCGVAMMVLQSPNLPHTLGEIRRQLQGNGGDTPTNLRAVLEGMKRERHEVSLDCVNLLSDYLNTKAVQTQSSILSNTLAGLSFLTNNSIDSATCKSDFFFTDLRKKKMTIYFQIPTGKVTECSTLSNLFFAQLINSNLKQGLPEKDPELNHSVVLMLDEFTAIGALEIVKKALGFIAGYGLRLVIVAQSQSQLIETYKKESAANIQENMHANILFTPLDFKMAKDYSDVLGDNTEIRRSSYNIGAKNPRSTTYSEVKRALMLPQEILTMPTKNSIVRMPAQKPIFSIKPSWLTNPELNAIMKSVEQHTIIVDGEKRIVPKPLDLPSGSFATLETQKSYSSWYLNAD